MSLLGRPWRLREVQDVEALARGILDAKLQGRGARLRSDLYDEAVCFLLEVAVRADQKYDPARCASFETFLGWKFHTGVVDFWRKELGRTRFVFSTYTHGRTLPDVLSLDAGGEGGLDVADAGIEGDLALSRADLQRALAG